MNIHKNAILLILITTFLTSTAQIFLKFSAGDLSFNTIKLLTNYNLLLGLFLYLVGGVLVITAIRRGEVTILYPILATSYVWVTLLSSHFFYEKINVFKWIGIVAIILGVSSIGFGSRNSIGKKVKYGN